MEKIKEYALKNYPSLFRKKRVNRNSKGKVASVTYTDYNPTIVDGNNHWRIYAHLNGSPLILSKEI